ncbi:MAG: di-trans,poly-cis-decaprenylcistransferase [Epulopiscium sp. Nele67-Bin004]|nr:MAG: di-trans,poly-cis-decaprenylcistransferase [Epulopiscium sp. Nele67-Bin004]
MHVAIIMDGNGRWATKNNLSRNEGHKEGSDVLKTIIDYANKRNVDYLTVYAFSTENWNRPKDEVDGLMKLLENYLTRAIRQAKKDDAKIRVIGTKDNLSKSIIDKMNKLEEVTKNNTGVYVLFAINYGGRDEIIRACTKIANDKASGKINNITEQIFNSYLDTHDIPDPDLLIRTSGEMRTSNFLPWQLAYTEFYFTEKLWPDFTKKDFDEALEVYSLRKRRFGKSE